MSVGEIISLYKSKEIIINPEFQRLFRWEDYQKTRFIESLLLGIPIPPIFVFQTKEGTWELVDGLQRLSTIFEFVGELKDADGNVKPYSILEGTKLLPSLEGKYWKSTAEDEVDLNAFTITEQLQVKRVRIRVEILKMESDSDAKYELFQRLNTGGSILSPQEVRNCIMVMSNREFYVWLQKLTELPSFRKTVSVTKVAQSEQKPMEMALRFFAYRNVPYDKKLDVNEYLDEATIVLSKMDAKKRKTEEQVFRKTFDLLEEVMGDNAFKKWDGSRHTGSFLVSGYEVIAAGVSKNITNLDKLTPAKKGKIISDKIKKLWSDDIFVKNSGMGVRGTTRLINLLPLGEKLFSIV